ncbi:MAG: hypothetical protein WC943_01115, partial [Elusimicrobiota bacterium]
MTLTAAPRRTLPDFGLAAKDIEAGAASAVAKAKARLEALASRPAAERTFENTVMEFDRIQDDLGNELVAHTFLQHVSPDEDVRNASRGCEAGLDKFLIDIWSREDIYAAIDGFASKARGLAGEDAVHPGGRASRRPSGKALAGEDAKLLKKTLDGFRRSGMALPPVERARLKVLKGQLVELELAYR